MGGKEASGGNLRVVPEGYRLFWGREPLVQEFNTAVSRSLAVQRFSEGETMFHTMPELCPTDRLREPISMRIVHVVSH